MRATFRVLLIWVLYVSLAQSLTIRNVDENADLDDLSYVQLEDDGSVKECDKLLNRKEPEDENLDHEIEGAFDGDEILTEEQLDLINSYNNQEKRKLKRKLSARWPGGIIPWEFNEGRRRFKNSTSYISVEKAIDHWQTYTCLKFINIRTEKNEYDVIKRQINHRNYLSFGTGTGCSSKVGYQKEAAQGVFLLEPGCLETGIIVHEIGHAIGFFHEQNRKDRDAFVDVMIYNVQRKKAPNFRKIPSDNVAPYDLGSVMHYGQKQFSIGPHLKTIRAKDENLNFLLGQRAKLSFYDIMAANEAYSCTDHCRQRANKFCQNGGFISKDCNCACPEGLTGTYCEEVELSWKNDDCGEILNLEDNERIIIKSPNNGRNYGPVKCFWLIKAPRDKHLNARLALNYLPKNRRTGGCFHWVEIRYNLMGQHGRRYCGRNGGHDIPRSTDNTLIIMFDGSDTNYYGIGFNVTISVDEASGTQGFY